MNTEITREIRLSDIIASSSCFPGGFEPMLFPIDYKNHGADIFNKYADELIEEKPEDFPMGIMDCGIYDNQRIDSIILAEKRVMEYNGTTNDKKEKAIVLFIISYVSSPYMYPIQHDEPKKLNWWRKLNFKKLLIAGSSSWLFAVLSIYGLFVSVEKWQVISLSISSSLLIIFGVLFSFAGNLLIKYFPRWFDIPTYFMRPLGHFQNIGFGVFENMIITRKNSVLKMVSQIFLKQIRSVSYLRVYQDSEWSSCLIMNAVYEFKKDDGNKRKNDINLYIVIFFIFERKLHDK